MGRSESIVAATDRDADFRHAAVLDVEVELPATRPGALIQRWRYCAETIRKRAELVQLAMDARRIHRNDETSFAYAPIVGDSLRDRSPEAIAAELSAYAEGYIFL